VKKSGFIMPDPTNLIQPYTTSSDQIAKLELDEDNTTNAPGDYIYWLAHIPPGASLVQPFYSNDGGSMQLISSVTLERSQSGLVLDDSNRSINLDYYPTGDPNIVFFGKEIELDTSKLRSGIVVPQGSYDGKQIYKFNIYYQVKFYRIRHRPNHPELISEDDGGQLWEDYQGSGDLKSFPVEIRAWWE